jgi:tRNA dimethylallyltransferase
LLLRIAGERGEVVSADSMQVYRGMDIGTAKPSREIRRALPHHLIDIRNPDQAYAVGDFAEDAEALLPGIRARGRLPVVSGGTAFYIRGLLFGSPEAPPPSQRVRETLRSRMEREGATALHAELSRVDAESASRIALNDGYRILRALEIYYTTGKPRSAFRQHGPLRRDIEPVLIGLYRRRDELYRRIDGRVEEMFRQGLLEEVLELWRAGYRAGDPGMRGIGYREVIAKAAARAAETAGIQEGDAAAKAVRRGGDTELRLSEASFAFSFQEREELLQEIARNSRRYAKRQLTFFRKLGDVRWIDTGSAHAGEELRRMLALE